MLRIVSSVGDEAEADSLQAAKVAGAQLLDDNADAAFVAIFDGDETVAARRRGETSWLITDMASRRYAA